MAILTAKGLTKAFRGIVAVQDVDLEVETNKIYSIIGPNGAGKTTLFNLLSGFYHCDAGRVFFRGSDITGLSPRRS